MEKHWQIKKTSPFAHHFLDPQETSIGYPLSSEIHAVFSTVYGSAVCVYSVFVCRSQFSIPFLFEYIY